jgi:peptidoglycan biosynthesis protein MviN/MurJ (putative lipid II flippase)
MENTFDEATQQLGAVRRARVAAWAPKPIPWWYRVGVGIAAGFYWALQDMHNAVLLAVSTLVYGCVIGVLLRFVARRQGGLTRPKGMPRRLQMAWAGSIIAMMTVIASCGAAVRLAGVARPWLWFGAFGGVALAVGIDLGARFYRRSFDRWMIETNGGEQ